MTNFLPRFALKPFILASACVALSGCGVDCDKEYAKGRKAFDERSYELAADSFRKVVQERPRDVDALFMLARAEFNLGHMNEAYRALKAAAVTNGSDPDILELSGQVAFYLNDYAAAEKYYSALALDSSRAPALRAVGWSGLGVIDFMRIGNNPEASVYRDSARVKFLKALELDYRSSSSRYNLARLYRDSFNYLDVAKEQFEYFVHLEKDDLNRVRQVREKILPSLKEDIAKRKASLPGISRRDPVASTELLRKADAFFAKKDYPKAREMYSKALSKDSFSYPAAVGLARSIDIPGAKKTEKADALEAYKRACSIRPISAECFISAGNLAYDIGKVALAAELYSRALALNPSNKNVLGRLVSCMEKSGNKAIAGIYSDYLKFLKSK